MQSIIIGSDPSGFALKEAVRAHLESLGYAVTDVGTTAETPVMFYDAARNLATAISQGRFARGIVICGSGMGVTLVANKYPGVYCAPCENVRCATQARAINNANVLAMGGKITSVADGIAITDAFLNTGFLEGIEGDDRRILQDGYAVMESLGR